MHVAANVLGEPAVGRSTVLQCFEVQGWRQASLLIMNVSSF